MNNIFDRYYKRYDAWYERNKFAFLSEIEALKKLLPAKKRGLEIGAGTGRFTQALGIAHGIDPSKNMIKIARKRGLNVRLACGERLPFKNNSFDYAAIIITICFTRRPEQVLQEAHRVLKKKAGLSWGSWIRIAFSVNSIREKIACFISRPAFLVSGR